MRALLACAIVWWTEPRRTGSNGLPVAIRALPSVQSSRSEGRASQRSVGLDSGMITGRSQYECISRTTSSENAPPRAEVPMRMVGWAFRMVSRRFTRCGSATSQPSISERGRA